MISSTTKRAAQYITSFFGYLKEARETKHQERPAGVQGKTMIRCAHTDFVLVRDDALGWIICFGACISIDEDDINFGYFNQCGRSGIVTATVHDNGAIEFDPEFDIVIDRDDYKESSPNNRISFAKSPSRTQPPITTKSNNSIVLEMV